MYRQLTFLLSFILVLTKYVCSQDYTDHRTYHSEIDSLENLLSDNSLDKEELLDVYYGLSFAYSEDDQDKFARYSLLAMDLAKDLKDHVTESAMLRNYIAYLSFNGYPDSVPLYYERALRIVKKIDRDRDNPEEVVDRECSLLYGTMGNFYNYIGDGLKAIEEYRKALLIFDRYNQKESQVILHSNVAQLYLGMNNIEMAESEMMKALDIANEMKDSLFLMYVNHDLCELEIKRENYEDAKRYADFCHDYIETHDEETLELSEISCILSKIYRNGYDDYDTAHKYASQALKVAEKYSSVPHLCNANLELGRIYICQEEWRKAETYIQKTLSLDDSDTLAVISCHKDLTKIYIHLNEHEKAVDCHEKVYELQAKYNNETYQAALANLELRFEIDKRDMQIRTLEREKRFQFLIALCVLIIVLSVVAWLIFIFRRLKEKNRIIRQKRQIELMESRMKGENDERIRLSRDLHDGLGGMLTGVKLKMELMGTGDSTKDSNGYEDSMRILKEAMTELRRISHHLMPSSLRTCGLKIALNDYCRNFDNVSFDFYGDTKRLDIQLEVLIYRIVHELVNNAIKHSGATSINVQIMQETDYIALMVHDNGCGFEVDKTSCGMGLNNIKERVSCRNGRMEILSEKGKGTDVNIEFELNTDNYDGNEQ